MQIVPCNITFSLPLIAASSPGEHPCDHPTVLGGDSVPKSSKSYNSIWEALLAMMILSRRMSSDVMLTSIRTLFPLFRRLSSEHVCLDANVRNVKLIMPNSSLICC